MIRIAIVAPCGPVNQDSLRAGKRNLLSHFPNCEFIEAPNLDRESGFLAGTDQERIDSLRWAFESSDADIIWIARGGFGAVRIALCMPWTDFAAESRARLVGYSDATLLLSSFAQAGGTAIHGPMIAADIARGFEDERTWNSIERLILSNDKKLNDDFLFEGRVLNNLPVKIDCRILAGNLTVFASTAGTKIFPSTKDKVIFLEDVNEEPYRVERALCQLLLSGFFDEAKAVVFGNFSNCIAETPERSFTIDEVKTRFSEEISIPVLDGFPFGHAGPNTALPLDANVRIESAEKGFHVRIILER